MPTYFPCTEITLKYGVQYTKSLNPWNQLIRVFDTWNVRFALLQIRDYPLSSSFESIIYFLFIFVKMEYCLIIFRDCIFFRCLYRSVWGRVRTCPCSFAKRFPIWNLIIAHGSIGNKKNPRKFFRLFPNILFSE